MNIGFGFNPAAIMKAIKGPSQAQVNQQAATGAGSTSARDSVAKSDQRKKAMHAVGAKVGERKVLDLAGITKPAAAKRG